MKREWFFITGAISHACLLSVNCLKEKEKSSEFWKLAARIFNLPSGY
jgi:hypothetical protein